MSKGEHRVEALANFSIRSQRQVDSARELHTCVLCMFCVSLFACGLLLTECLL